MAVRYSNPNIASAKFSWEYPVPVNEFWNPIKFTTARNFLKCFSPEEVEKMPLDGSLSNPEKFQVLLKILQERLSTAEAAAAPKTLYDINFQGWANLWFAISTLHLNLNDVDEATRIIKFLHEKRQDPKNLSYLHNLAGIMIESGKWAEAEEMEGPVLVWLEEIRGKHAPNALGARRIIIRAVWKQGPARRKDAQDKIKELFDLIEESGNGIYAEYQAEETQITEDMLADLKKEDV